MRLLQKLLCKNVEIKNAPFVQIVNSVTKQPIGSGYIKSVNLVDMKLNIKFRIDKHEYETREILLSNIQSIGRMKDRRFRMWIKED